MSGFLKSGGHCGDLSENRLLGLSFFFPGKTRWSNRVYGVYSLEAEYTIGCAGCCVEQILHSLIPLRESAMMRALESLALFHIQRCDECMNQNSVVLQVSRFTVFSQDNPSLTL